MGASTVAEYRVKEAAQERGYTLHRLAEETGMSEPRLRAIANNRVPNVTIRTLELIASQLQVPLRDIFTRESWDSIPTFEGRKPAD